MSAAHSVTPAVRRTRPFLYSGLALLSLLAAPFLWSFMLFGGVLTVFFGAVIGALSRAGPRQDRAVVAVCCGLALLTGPVTYMLLAIAV